MLATEKLAAYIKVHPGAIGKVVDFDVKSDKLYPLDFTAANAELTPELVADTEAFSQWINKKLSDNNARYGIGGYMEHRTIYNRSALFDTDYEPRRLHLGVDIWGNAGTPVYSPLAGTVHSFADNDNFGDYGPCIILQHDLDGLTLYSLYGHLSRASLVELQIGQSISINQQIATLGHATENGHWPPHLHFQLMLDIGDARGDYPGVGQYSRKVDYIENIPDANLILAFSGLPVTSF
ncbi:MULTISPECIES: peptidoglycan DD-metalloendopeptidase family protein [unclassified Mucilaginibacter]|uniref:peptidoglycan DD-metalloendopeptidase family protein n=1 Tax=unclassified Mucilaginibacter TaxID=2617802 RepID=UPI002AC9D2A9|nr:MULTISPECIES: peptidoglycan DD-metalloendopeptidase family protein [unclassified Mucilaginibacter]MEB0263772.1 peptidoglycan DD-metalloendopeptidase family protein [Mucilaginibacter sp. 10I4]MEB0280243.1 peptidoglycan DD-metalloendopeptidase family protein [Mucilaginibacter sp. 10B2]MEB0301134.1 peptidoglycan DD-metalloendopeptidase family protein [Mucilaginibacter sp. 5C4]WPX24348.1 peptidoglycan DD-metalloendopeptidase family protein [Mucilaginibacter sp. 5C4]